MELKSQMKEVSERIAEWGMMLLHGTTPVDKIDAYYKTTVDKYAAILPDMVLNAWMDDTVDEEMVRDALFGDVYEMAEEHIISFADDVCEDIISFINNMGFED